MKITIKKKVFQKLHPRLQVAVIAAKEIDDQSKLDESKHLLDGLEKMTKLLFLKEKPQTHHLIAPWEIIKYKTASKNKKTQHYQTAVERLLKKVLRGKSVKSSSVLTNLVRYISLKHLIPAAVDDLDKIKGSLNFDLAQGNERASVLKGLKKDTFYYRDEKGILGTKLDYWHSSRAKVTRKTNNFFVHLEALPPLTDKKLKEVTAELAGLISSFSGGKVKGVILNQKKNSAAI